MVLLYKPSDYNLYVHHNHHPKNLMKMFLSIAFHCILLPAMLHYKYVSQFHNQYNKYIHYQ